MKSVALHNLGCKVNSYEMDVMQQMLQDKGYKIVPFDEVADIYIVNTCTVTNIADRKSRQMLHQAKTRNPKAVVVAVGCYVQTEEKKSLLDGFVDLAIGNNRKKDLVSILEKYLKVRENNDNSTTNSRETDVLDMNTGCDYEEMTLQHTADHTRAYIKIQDGCNQFCTYCIIPFARGRVRSRRWEDIRDELLGLSQAGYKEVVLTGIHISSYGIDFDDIAWNHGKSVVVKKESGQRDYAGKTKLLDLLERIQNIDGIERIRLGSLEPRIMTPDNVVRLSKMPKICPHFHLSLQSGCDKTLSRMNRHYTTCEYFECVENLRKVFSHPAITTDVIVGFPGETEEEFEQTVAFLEKVNLYEMHIFKYSARKGTKAATMPGQVTKKVQIVRSNRLFAMEKEQSRAFRAAYIGKTVTVLFEDQKEMEGKTYQIGYTKEYVRVAMETSKDLSNQMIKGTVKKFLEEDLLLME